MIFVGFHPRTFLFDYGLVDWVIKDKYSWTKRRDRDGGLK